MSPRALVPLTCLAPALLSVGLTLPGAPASGPSIAGATGAPMEPSLFDEPRENPLPLRGGWLLPGCYVVLGLAAGALCASVAVARALPPLPWFFLGLVLNVLALVILLMRPRGDCSALPGGVPPGLAKVPTTRPPRHCPSCGGENHPSARLCARCGASLEPTVDPEIARL